MKVDLIARKSFGRAKVGDKVSLPRREAKILIATGHMALAPAAAATAAAAKRTYRRRDMTAEPAAVETVVAVEPPVEPPVEPSVEQSAQAVPALTTERTES